MKDLEEKELQLEGKPGAREEDENDWEEGDLLSQPSDRSNAAEGSEPASEGRHHARPSKEDELADVREAEARVLEDGLDGNEAAVEEVRAEGDEVRAGEGEAEVGGSVEKTSGHCDTCL